MLITKCLPIKPLNLPNTLSRSSTLANAKIPNISQKHSTGKLLPEPCEP